MSTRPDRVGYWWLKLLPTDDWQPVDVYRLSGRLVYTSLGDTMVRQPKRGQRWLRLHSPDEVQP